MIKVVNGKKTEIRDIELFEEAFASIAMGRVMTIRTGRVPDKEEAETVKKLINTYNFIVKKLPFPLYAVEGNCKYSAVASIMRKKYDVSNKMWIDNALCVKVSPKTYVKIHYGSWELHKINEENKVKDTANLEDYASEVGYRHFKWAVEAICSGKGTDGYFKEFMGEFLEACGGEINQVFKWELSNILSFVPEGIYKKIEIQENVIIDYTENKEYRLDVYTKSVVKPKQIAADGNLRYYVRPRGERNRYDFDIYEKDINLNSSSILDGGGYIGKMKASKKDGLAAIFEAISVEYDELDEICYYAGVVVQDKAVFEVDGKTMVCGVSKYEEAKLIGIGVKTVGVNKSCVFLEKSETVKNKVRKVSMYAYNVNTERISLCSIRFE